MMMYYFRKSKSSSQSYDSEPTIPPPPVMPQNEKAPWINIESSVLSSNWSKLINQQQFSDVVIHLESKQYYTHRYVLCSSSDIMRQLLLGEVKEKLKSESLSQCPQWSSKRLKNLTPNRINDGREEGFVSIVTENQYVLSSLCDFITCLYIRSVTNGLPTVHITLNHELFTELSLKRCLEFLYTGFVNVDKNSEALEETIRAAALLNLPELQMICENAQKEDEYLNPSIGTWLNDHNSSVAKQLFFNKPLLSDVQFIVEGQTVHAHKIVLATRCDVLGAMLTGGFSESSTHQVIVRTIYITLPLLYRLSCQKYLMNHSWLC